MISDFSKQIKEGTKKSHSMAENTSFVASFLRGVIDQKNYRQLVANFYFIYHELETEVRRLKDDPYVGPLKLSALERHDALVKDCEFYFGENWKDNIYPTAATKQYIARIREVAHEDPKLLVGHHYTRYLGDLSGGQILRNIAENAMNLTDGGLEFYDFPEIEDKKAYKQMYRETLNKLPVDQSDVNAIITEANYAFRLNMYMFEEMEGDYLVSMVRYLCSVSKKTPLVKSILNIFGL